MSDIPLMSDEQIDAASSEWVYIRPGRESEQYAELRDLARAIESAARAPLLERIQALEAERDAHQHSAAWCEKHKPAGGQRAMCLVCACQSLSAALSRISYLCGKPNEMECGPYDVHSDESAVVAEVSAALAEVEALRAVLGGSIKHDYQGLCPDDQQPTARDPECPACKVLGAARSGASESGGGNG